VKIFFCRWDRQNIVQGYQVAGAPSAGIHGVKKNALYKYALEQQGE